jgi:hypothetical protein
MLTSVPELFAQYDLPPEFLLDPEERRLFILSKSKDPQVRARVAGDLNIPISAQWILSRDTDEYVRIKLAGNWKVSMDVKNSMVHDSSAMVRMNLWTGFW